MNNLTVRQRIRRRLKENYLTFLRNLKSRLRRLADLLEERGNGFYDRELTFPQVVERLTAPGGDHVYRYFEQYYSLRAPKWIRELREYYVRQGSFGEAAFFALWYKLWMWHKPKRCLEIGVFKGQTLALWTMLSTQTGISAEEICGLSTFDGLGDSVSTYAAADYEKVVRDLAFNYGLPCPTLAKMKSDSKEGKKLIEEGRWDLIYIDGSHDYESVISDYLSAKEGLVTGGLLVMDDSSLLLEGTAPASALRFPGHPGPSKVLSERARVEMNHLLTVGHNNVLEKT